MNAVELKQQYPLEGAGTPPPMSWHQHHQSEGQADGADLAVVVALLAPGAVFVRERNGGGTWSMRREADGCWYFID